MHSSSFQTYLQRVIRSTSRWTGSHSIGTTPLDTVSHLPREYLSTPWDEMHDVLIDEAQACHPQFYGLCPYAD
jgi:hypothetical protein